MKRHTPSYELGRWNSHIKKKDDWEYYVDMANYDNCYQSLNNDKLLSKKSSIRRNQFTVSDNSILASNIKT
jgi:hypothetical protein